MSDFLKGRIPKRASSIKANSKRANRQMSEFPKERIGINILILINYSTIFYELIGTFEIK